MWGQFYFEILFDSPCDLADDLALVVHDVVDNIEIGLLEVGGREGCDQGHELGLREGLNDCFQWLSVSFVEAWYK